MHINTHHLSCHSSLAAIPPDFCLPTHCRLFSLHLQPPCPLLQAHPLELLYFFPQFLPLEWDPVCLFWRGPKPRHREAILEVGTEVIHPTDWEHDVEAELFAIFCGEDMEGR